MSNQLTKDIELNEFSEECSKKWVDCGYFENLSPQSQNEPHPLVSVIVPVYNCDHYIKDCLDSVIHRNKVPWNRVAEQEF